MLDQQRLHRVQHKLAVALDELLGVRKEVLRLVESVGGLASREMVCETLFQRSHENLEREKNGRVTTLGA